MGLGTELVLELEDVDVGVDDPPPPQATSEKTNSKGKPAINFITTPYMIGVMLIFKLTIT